MRLADYAKLSTEKSNPRSRNLDRLTPLQMIRLMNQEDAGVIRAVGHQALQIARAVSLVSDALRRGKRFYLFGAGTSGRLGVIEAAECPPTFNTRASQIQALMAGGRAAVFKSKEGAEDSGLEASRAVRRRVRKGDVVLGIAASGVTPFVRSALRTGRRVGARTILLTCNPQSTVPGGVDLAIHLRTGPEVLTGSTRLKAGTACKMTLNMITTASMVQIGKVYGHWMVDLQPKSRKLVARGIRLIAQLGGVSESKAAHYFRESGGHVKLAVLMAKTGSRVEEARTRLSNSGGFLREALSEVKT